MQYVPKMYLGSLSGLKYCLAQALIHVHYSTHTFKFFLVRGHSLLLLIQDILYFTLLHTCFCKNYIGRQFKYWILSTQG